MSTTPGKPNKPRQSGIAPPGKFSGIPTPGRPRSTSQAGQIESHGFTDNDYASRAFMDAMKTNNPIQHKGNLNGGAPNVLRPSNSQNGRRSVGGFLPSASTSSVASTADSQASSTRSKTPSRRPVSRQSDVFQRSSSRAGRIFDVGDSVRIESLGYEGVLRYVGEIDGKQGLWAGVELSGGFFGKGKNDGTVDGRRYFACPPKCGVFVAMSKLSSPTVGSGASRRPSSVASSHDGGRVTPVLSGRVTPSFSSTNGRITPATSRGQIPTTPSSGSFSSSRIGLRTPSAAVGAKSDTSRSTSRTSSNAHSAFPPRSPSTNLLSKQITAGSRASKYVGLTAKELDSRTMGEGSPRSTSVSRNSSSATSSPSLDALQGTRLPSSPFNTPKPNYSNGLGSALSASPSRVRPSDGTPRPRIPSAVAMPPPSSPSLRSISRSEHVEKDLSYVSTSSPDAELNGLSFPESLAQRTQSPQRLSMSRPTSSASRRSIDINPSMDMLQSRLRSVEYENQRLRIAAEDASNDRSKLDESLKAARTERDDANSRILNLESQIKTAERSLNERDARIDNLERSIQQLTVESEQRKTEGDNRVKDLQSRLDDNAALVGELKQAIEAKEGQEDEAGAILKAKNAEIALLQSRVDQAYADLAFERKELGEQIDELRLAGQETIALYEERLSGAESKRYELEDQIAELESRLKTESQETEDTESLTLASKIDNETLREQVQHLQKKITSLEDALEDARIVSEREENNVRERIRRFKERDETMRKELSDGRKEVEQMSKSEGNARRRVEELEEALRESTYALENSRADIESLRAELANSMKASDALQASTSSRSDSQSSKEEITGLKHIVQELQKENTAASQRNKLLESENRLLLSETDQLRQELKLLEGNMKRNTASGESLRSSTDGKPVNGSSTDEKDDKLELEQLRRRVAEIEMKNARVIHDLNKEISELEALVEAKIYREDELEQEVERLRDKLARTQKKSSKGLPDAGESRARQSFASVSSLAASFDSSGGSGAASENVCEICERPGHDIFNCDLLKDDPPSSAVSRQPRAPDGAATSELFCEECESHGHVAANCPHSLDVF